MVNKKWRKKQTKGIVIGLVATAAILTTGSTVGQGTLAYLTDYGNLINQFTQGGLEIVPSEPNWPGDQNPTVPGDVIAKNPMISAGKGSQTPAYVYMQIKMPYGKVTKVNDDGTLYDKDMSGKRLEKLHQLVTFGVGEPIKQTVGGEEAFQVGEAYQPDSESVLLDTDKTVGHGLTTAIRNSSDGWTLLKTELTERAEGDPEQVKGYVVYTYAYNSMVADTEDALVKESYGKYITDNVLVSKTTSLFEKVRLINCVEGQLDKVKLQVPIKTFAIQAAHTGNDADKDNNNISGNTATVIQYAKTAFEKYANQNADNGTATVKADNFVVNAVRDAQIHWIFRTDLEEECPKTGDDRWGTAYLGLAVLSGALGFWRLFCGRERRNK